jgi:hypothetical protein
MDTSPDLATVILTKGDLPADGVDVGEGPATLVVPELDGPARTVQSKPRLPPLADDMNVGRRVIEGVHHHPVSASTEEDGRHGCSLSQNLNAV